MLPSQRTLSRKACGRAARSYGCRSASASRTCLQKSALSLTYPLRLALAESPHDASPGWHPPHEEPPIDSPSEAGRTQRPGQSAKVLALRFFPMSDLLRDAEGRYKAAIRRRNALERGWKSPGLSLRTTLRLHDLRHYAVSRLIEQGANIMLVSRIAGHAKPSVTLDVYAHLFADGIEEAAVKYDPLAPSRREVDRAAARRL